MQVVCGNCQLNFDAPEGATGLVCPICRSPLRAQAAADGGSAKKIIDWNGGTLDDLIALVTAPAVSARVEVLPATGDNAAGEVHLLAGGVSEAIFDGKSTDDALDKLRAVPHARFRIEQRLPNPADGDLTFPGPESGTLDGRPLAHLMRYCEDYVITCGIEVWRGNENARVEYRRGEIAGVTVGGIDAPERLAEVMQWASGNYRLMVPEIKLPAVAPKRPQAAASTPAPVPAPAPSAQAARQQSATKTMFGIPAAELAAARAAAEATLAAHNVSPPVAAAAPAPAPAPQPAAVTAAPAPAPAPAPVVVEAPAPAAPPVAAAPAPAAARPSATKTMFGVPAPQLPEGYAPVTTTPAAITEPPAESEEVRKERERKTGARKVQVPRPELSPPPPAAMAAAAPAPTPAAAAPVEVGRATHHGYDSSRAPEAASKKAAAAAEKTQPTRVAPTPRAPQTAMWTYVGVGFTFGLALLGIYQLVGRLAH